MLKKLIFLRFLGKKGDEKMKPIRVIIVEDDPMVMDVNKQYIEKVGDFLIVGTAETGQEALELAKKEQPDLMVLDLYLPDIDGLTTLKKIREENIPTDVILVTAARDSETIQNVFRYGATDYIIKPFKYERLKASLDSYKQLHRKIFKKQNLDQEDLDGMAVAKVHSKDPLPKGLNEVTLRQIFLYMVKKRDSLSAEDVAEGVGLARVTARRYLDYLEKSGRLRLEIQYGSVGRPINRYSTF